jgi:hypothetical protein
VLELAHERSVRRIVVEVIERPRGSLFLAVGRSAEVREAVEAALAERMPEVKVARAMLRAGESPWARIVDAAGPGEEPVLVSAAGLGEIAEEQVDEVLAHLNLGREVRVERRLHVLLWVGGAGAAGAVSREGARPVGASERGGAVSLSRRL